MARSGNKKTSTVAAARHQVRPTPQVTYAPAYQPGPYSLQSMIRFLTDNAGLIFLALAIFIGGFLLGSIWTENMMLKKGIAAGTTAAAGTQQAAQAAQQPTAPQVQVTEDQIKGLFKEGNVFFGDPNSKVLFVDVSDPSCPWCHVAAGKNNTLNNQLAESGYQTKLVADGGTYVAPVPEMRKLVEAGKAAYVWIYSNGHGNGEMGTKAMYCANEQGKYWEAHDLLMTNDGYNLLNNTIRNDKTKSGELVDFLKSVVNATTLKSCLDSGKYDSRPQADQQVSSSIGIQGTPGFFINTTSFSGAVNYKEQMEPVVNQALN